jgi:pyridoxine kinase
MITDRSQSDVVIAKSLIKKGFQNMTDSEKDEFFEYYNQCIPCIFHGTGDVFASCCVGAMVRGMDVQQAMKTAADFVVEAIRRTLEDPESRWYGVNFEEALPWLMRKLAE